MKNKLAALKEQLELCRSGVGAAPDVQDILDLFSALDNANERGDKLAAELRRWIDKDIAADAKIKELEADNKWQVEKIEQWQDRTSRADKERDAALARVKELENHIKGHPLMQMDKELELIEMNTKLTARLKLAEEIITSKCSNYGEHCESSIKALAKWREGGE